MAPAFPSSLCLTETSGALCKDPSHVSLDAWSVVTEKIIQSSGAGVGMELGTVTFSATVAATQQRLYFRVQCCPPKSHPKVHTEASVKLSGALPADYVSFACTFL